MNINNLTGNINNNKTDYFPKGKDDKVTMLLVQSEQLLDVDSTKNRFHPSTKGQTQNYNRRNYRQILRNITYSNRTDRVAQLAEHYVSILKVVGCIHPLARQRILDRMFFTTNLESKF